MLYSPAKVNRLIARVANVPLERCAPIELAYAMLYRELPPILADIFTKNKQMLKPEHVFYSHFAFGVVESNLEFRLEQQRAARTKQMFRQLGMVEYYLGIYKQESQVIKSFTPKFWRLQNAVNAARDLAETEQIPPMLAGVLVEQLILAFTNEPTLMVMLIENLSKSWPYSSKNFLIRHVSTVIDSGVIESGVIDSDSEQAISASPPLVDDLSTPYRFLKADLDDPRFVEAAKNAVKYLKDAFV